MAKPFRFTKAMSMPSKAEWSEVSLYPSPRMMATFGRAERETAEGELGERVRTLMA
jgi:hypothetical protein